MARLNIDTGTLGNPATGDTLRTAMTKINSNFEDLYLLVGDPSTGLLTTNITNGDVKIQPNGTGSIEIDTLSIQNSTITSITTNSDITITPNGTGNVVLGNFTFNADQTVGAGQDNYVFTYDHSTGTIGLEASAAGDVTASSTTTFTNKTFDADGTGNSITNIDLANLKSDVLDTDLSSVSGADDTIASAKAIKAYVDAEDANIASDSMTFTNKSGNISQWTNDSNYATQAYVDARDIGDLSVVGSTISAPSNATLTLTTSGSGNISLFDNTSVQGTLGVSSDITVDGTFNRIGDFTFSGTSISSGSSTAININEQLNVDGALSVGGDITGTFAGTMDADTATVSNIEVDNFKASAIVTEAEGIASNDNDTTLPTSAAVKDYVDNNAGGSTGDLTITGSTISAPSNADLTLTTAGTGSVSVDGIQISGTELSSSDSTQITIKENLHVTGNITGTLTGSVAFSNVTSTPTTISGYGITDAASSTATALTVVGDDSSGTAVTLGETFKVAGATGITTAVSGDTLTITGPTLTSYITASSSDTLTNKTIDANGTGNSISNIEVADFAGSAIINVAETLASNDSDTALVTAGAIIDYVDAQDANIASDTLTFTNKTFDVEGTGNSISNIDVADFKAAAIVTEAEGIGSNDNDTTLPTSAAVKDYVDNNAGGSTGDLTITGSTITTPSNADLTLNPGGTGQVVLNQIKSEDSSAIQINDSVNVSGGMTVAGGDLVTADISSSGNIDAVGFTSTGNSTFDGVQISDNKVTSASSNADLELDAAGTGGIVAQAAMTFNGNAIFNTGVEEAFDTLTSSTGTVTHNCDNGHIFYHTSPSADFTANFTNLGLTAEYGTTLTVIVNQGATARLPTAVQIGGVAQTLNWQGGLAPTGTDNGIDVVSFTVLNDGGTYVVLAQMVDFT